MLPEKFWKIVAGLGVPGLALGVLYALLRLFKWDLAVLPVPWLAVLMGFFLVLVGIVTLLALHYWRPARPGIARSSVKVGGKARIEGAIAGRDLLARAQTSAQPADETAVTSTVVIGKEASIGGPVAGRDLHIHPDEVRGRVTELVGILEDRAERIRCELSAHFLYAKVGGFLRKFDELHRQHITNLLDGHVIRAHEVHQEIHKLSFELQSDEFWTRHRRETPDVRSSLNFGAFQRGPLIYMYVGSAAMEQLVEQALYPHRNKEKVKEDLMYHLIGRSEQ